MKVVASIRQNTHLLSRNHSVASLGLILASSDMSLSDTEGNYSQAGWSVLKWKNLSIWLCKGRQGVNCNNGLEAVLSLIGVAFISKSRSSFASWRAKKHSKRSRIFLANRSSMTDSDFSWSFSSWYTLMRERYSKCYIQHSKIYQSWVPLGKWNKKYKNLGSIKSLNWTCKLSEIAY